MMSSTYARLIALPVVRRNALLFRDLNPFADEFYGDLESKGVFFDRVNRIPVEYHSDFRKTIIRPQDRAKLMQDMADRCLQRREKEGRAGRVVTRLRGIGDITNHSPQLERELLLAESVGPEEEVRPPWREVLLDARGRLRWPFHPIHGNSTRSAWEGALTGTPRTLELLGSHAPMYLKLSIARSAVAAARRGACVHRLSQAVLRARLARTQTRAKKYVQKLLFDCDNPDVGCLSRDDVVMCIATSQHLARAFTNAPAELAYLPELIGWCDLDGTGALLRSGEAIPRADMPEFLLPFYSLGSLSGERGGRVHLLRDLALDTQRSPIEVAVRACSLYLQLWYFMAFDQNYLLCCPHGQNAMLALSDTGHLRRIVLIDMRDIEHLEQYYSSRAAFPELTPINERYLVYEHFVHPRYYRFRPYPDRMRQLAANALAYSYWMLHRRAFEPIYRALERLNGDDIARRARAAVLCNDIRELSRRTGNSQSLQRLATRAQSSTTRDLEGLHSAFYAALRAEWIVHSLESCGGHAQPS